MTEERVQILLGAPDGATTDAARIETLARKYWPQIKDRATGTWRYPLGWSYYFKDDRVVDITQYRE